MKINKLEEEPFLIRCRKQNKWGFRDSNNKIILPPIYDYAENFSEGLASVKLNGKHGYIDKMEMWSYHLFMIPHGPSLKDLQNL